MGQRFLLMGCLLTLSGCFSGAHWMSTEYLTGRGWAQPPEQVPQEPLYCYKTLGKVDCYRTPQPDKGRPMDPLPLEAKEAAAEELPLSLVATP